MKKHLLFTGILLSSVFANNGKETYTAFCSACHGAEGQGVKGAAPPLSNSEWVAGNPSRMAQILLRGLMGPMHVKGVPYDLAMPPQTALDDQKVADIMNYVRSSWGNSGSAVGKDFIATERRKTKYKIDMWHPGVISKMYPFTNKRQKIGNLICETYAPVNDFKEIETRKPNAVEEENSGAIKLNQGGENKESFTARWSGSLNATKAGDYTFSLVAGGATKLIVNDETLFDFKEKQSIPSTAKITLPEGDFTIEYLYSHQAGEAFNLEFYWSGKGFDLRPLHDTQKPKARVKHILKPEPGRALIHRNFYRKGHGRELAVGFAEKLNFIFCTEKLNMRALWKGGFLDVGEAWNGRAVNKHPKPQAKLINLADDLPYTLASNPLTTWTKADAKSYQFKGYQYDKKGNPTFKYLISGIMVSDHFAPSSDGKALIRTITAQKTPDGKSLFFKVLRSFKKQNGSSFEFSSLNVSINKPPAVLEDKSVAIRLGSSPVKVTYRCK